ncbi:MAG: CBS domain-containing protein [Candidatus Aenigmarchaeota archaeon]|nr:CBS domain-containing protein [Candidatus Aenigmarchaeota archaeon]
MENITVRNIMSTRVATIGIDQSVMEASQIMDRDKVNCLVVMGGRSAVGIISDSDITRYVVSKGLDPKQTKVIEIMSSPLVFVNPNDGVEKASEILINHKINKLVVIENGNLVGIITDSDISNIKPAVKQVKPASPGMDISFMEGMNKRPDWDRGSGFCDNCGHHEDDLVNSGEEKLCRSCLDKKRQAGPYWVSKKRPGSSFTG